MSIVPNGVGRVSVTIRGERADLSREHTIEIEVQEGDDQLFPQAIELRTLRTGRGSTCD